ncbi:MAG: hypothetical protein Q8K92_20090, partial [Leadbetterella sp.]|nr:hypothetical protein [Leadbetterella sp.]
QENPPKIVELDPMESISIYFEEDLDGVAKAEETIVKPAIYLNLLNDTASKKDLWDVIDLIAVLLSFIPFLNAGLAGLAKVLAYLDATIAAMSIVVTQNEDKLPKSFVEAFRVLEIATIGFAFVKSPKAIDEVAEQVARMDEAVALISKMDNIPQALKDNVKLIQKIFAKQVEMGKNINKADAATLRKLLDEIDAAGMIGSKFENLRNAILKRLDDLESKVIKTADEIGKAQQETADAIYNAAQKSRVAGETAETMVTVAKPKAAQGTVLINGRVAEIKDALGKPIAEIEFPDTKSLNDWLAHNKQVRYVDPKDAAGGINELMHPWFYRNGQRVSPERYPHLFDANKNPLGINEIFGVGKQSKTKLALLNSIGDLRAATTGKLYSGIDPQLILELGKVAFNYLRHNGSIVKDKFIQFLTDAGLKTSDYPASTMKVFVDTFLPRLNKLFQGAIDTSDKQKAFLDEILARFLKGEIDDDMVEKLIKYNNTTPKGYLSVDDVIENYREGMIFNEKTKRFRTALDELVQTVDEAIPGFGSLGRREQSLAILSTSEPKLAEALANLAGLNINANLKKAIDDILKNQTFSSALELAVERRKLVKILNQTIGEGIESLHEFEEIISLVSYSKGMIGEYFAYAKRYLGKKGDKIIFGLSLNVDELGFLNKIRVSPDQLIYNGKTARLGEIKTGYNASDISPDQIENYLRLIDKAENPQIAKQLDLPEGVKLNGLDYLFLPGGKNLSAKDAAEKAYAQIKKHSDLAEESLINGTILVKYLDSDGGVQIFKPLKN